MPSKRMVPEQEVAELSDRVQQLDDENQKFMREIAALTEQRDAARDYLIRHILQPLHPHINPLPDLIGVCTQVDNLMVGVVEHQDALTEQRDRAIACLQEIADMEGSEGMTDYRFAERALAIANAFLASPTPQEETR